MSPSKQRKRWSMQRLPIIPALVALVLAVGALYAQTAQKTTPDGISDQVRPVNTVTTDDAECTWGLDLNGYSTGTTYSGTFSISATGNPATSWIATFNQTAGTAITNPGTVTDAASHTATGVAPNPFTYAWTGSGGPALGTNVTLSIPAQGTHRALTCTAKLTTLTTDIHVATSGTDGPTCGAPATPCKTIDYGQTRAGINGSTKVFVHSGTFGSFTLQSGITVLGGVGGGTTTVSSMVTASVNGTIENMSITGSGTGVLVAGGSPLLKNNIINSGTPTGAGSSAYGVRVTGGSPTINGGTVTAKAGIAGANASAGKPNTPSAPCGPANGDDGGWGTDYGVGASPCSTGTDDYAAQKGGAGGNGGKGALSYTNGTPGGTGAGTGGGAGGAGGGNYAGIQATSGSGGNGGSAATPVNNGGTNTSALAAGLDPWSGGSGGVGLDGNPGFGGGGGGGGRSASFPGGGGGAGSNGGNKGKGGTQGGAAGGGSFGVYVVNSASLTLIGSPSITASNGGNGGFASVGGDGGNASNGSDGGNKGGGNAGEGGGGGGGGGAAGGSGAGGGAGGPSIALYFQSSGSLTGSGSYSKGSGGDGGDGGTGGNGGTGGTGGCNTGPGNCDPAPTSSSITGTGPKAQPSNGGWNRGGGGGKGEDGNPGADGEAGQAYDTYINGTHTP